MIAAFLAKRGFRSLRVLRTTMAPFDHTGTLIVMANPDSHELVCASSTAASQRCGPMCLVRGLLCTGSYVCAAPPPLATHYTSKQGRKQASRHRSRLSWRRPSERRTDRARRDRASRAAALVACALAAALAAAVLVTVCMPSLCPCHSIVHATLCACVCARISQAMSVCACTRASLA